MADEGFKLQVSLKDGADMLNVRADNVHELEALLREASEAVGTQRFFGGSLPKPSVVQPVVDPSVYLQSTAQVPVSNEPALSIEEQIKAKMKKN